MQSWLKVNVSKNQALSIAMVETKPPVTLVSNMKPFGLMIKIEKKKSVMMTSCENHSI